MEFLFNFRSNLSGTNIPLELNNPFTNIIPKIANIAVSEFQEYLAIECEEWNQDLFSHKGKMFGVLVVQRLDKNYGFLGTASGKLPHKIIPKKLIPSIFDDSTDDYFINKGMSELTELNHQINQARNPTEIKFLKERRKKKSHSLQQQLFENYNFINQSGQKKNVIEVFESSMQSYPPSAAGECAAPKLLQYAFKQNLKPIAIAEFWWGKTSKNKEREHKQFYPACEDKCLPILGFMLEDNQLFTKAINLT